MPEEPKKCQCILPGCHEWPGCEADAEEEGRDLGIVGHPTISLCAKCADVWTEGERFDYYGMIGP